MVITVCPAGKAIKKTVGTRRVDFHAGPAFCGVLETGSIGVWPSEPGNQGEFHPGLLEVPASVNTPSGFAVFVADIDC